MIRQFPLVLPLAVILFSGSLRAETNQYFVDDEDGWYWYEDPPAPVEPEPETPPAPPPAPVAAPPEPTEPSQVAGSVAWLREALPQALDVATDNPSPENVERYYLLQKMAADKSERFAEVAQMVTAGHPELDEGRRRPRQDNFSKQMEAVASKAKSEVLSDLFKTTALVMFLDKNCSGCGLMADNFYKMGQTHGLVWQAVSMDGTVLPEDMNVPIGFDQGLSEKLGVVDGGAVFLASPPNKYIAVTWNPTGGAEIADRVLLVARRSGLITEAQFASTRAINPMVSVPDPILANTTPDILKEADAYLRQTAPQTTGD